MSLPGNEPTWCPACILEMNLFVGAAIEQDPANEVGPGDGDWQQQALRHSNVSSPARIDNLSLAYDTYDLHTALPIPATHLDPAVFKSRVLQEPTSRASWRVGGRIGTRRGASEGSR